MGCYAQISPTVTKPKGPRAYHTLENSTAASATKAIWHVTNISPALASAKSMVGQL